MRSFHLLGLAAACLLLGACGTSTDGGSPDAGPPALTVTFLEPESETVPTHASVHFRVQVVGVPAERVQLLLGEDVLAELAPPYEYTWDTAQKPEGSYRVTARAFAKKGTFQSPARTVVVDRTPPALLSQVPAAGEDNVYINDPITLTFSEPLLASTLTNTSVGLTDGSFSGYGPSLALSAEGKTLTLTQSIQLSAPAHLSVYLLSDVTDLAGNPIDEFLVLSKPWSLPDWHAPPGVTGAASSSIRYHSLAVPPEGPPILVWEGSGLCAARWDGRAWKPLGSAASGACGSVGAYGSSPTVVLDGNGQPVVLWRDSAGLGVSRWDGAAWRPFGGGIRIDALATALRPALALDGAGQPVLAWDDSNGQSIDLHVARWTGSAWQPVGGALSAGPGWADAPSLAVDGAGNPVVAWQQSDATGNGERVNVWRWSGSAWQPLGGPMSAAGGRVDAVTPSLALDAQGGPVVAWSESQASASSLYVRRWNGSAWEPVGEALSATAAGGTPSATRPSLALDKKGAPVVAWEEADAVGVRQVHVRRWDGSAWKVLGEALGALPGSTDALFPVLTLDAAGRPSVAWSENGSVFVRRSNRM